MNSIGSSNNESTESASVVGSNGVAISGGHVGTSASFGQRSNAQDFYNSNSVDLSAFTNHSIDQITTTVNYTDVVQLSNHSHSHNHNHHASKLHGANSNSSKTTATNGYRLLAKEMASNDDSRLVGGGLGSTPTNTNSCATSSSSNANELNSNKTSNSNSNASNSTNSNSNSSSNNSNNNSNSSSNQNTNSTNDKTTSNGSNNNDLNNDENNMPNGNGSKLAFNRAHSFSNGQKDVLRIIGQYLRYLGLNKTTETLIDESTCMLEHPTATNFCSLIMSGSWDEAERALESLRTLMDDSNTDIINMKFLILEQKYLECLEDGKIFEALKCLRDEMAPLKHNIERLHELSSFLMCSDQCNLKILSKWSGKSVLSRQTLMDKLQSYLPPNIMLPPHRLEILLKQSIELQCERCPFHNIDTVSSIDDWHFLRDHICSKDQFPSVCLQVINDHCDEVWYCKFSNNGKQLATGSKDGCLIIWDIDTTTFKLSLNKSYEDHSTGVGYIAWSPDDRYVIVCGTEESTELWIWDVQNKTLKKRVNNNHDDSLTCAAWLPDGQNFVAGGLKGQFYYCDLDGNVRDTWEGIRVRCLQVLPDGLVLAADTLKRIRSYNFKDISDSNLIQEDFNIMSFSLNQKGNLALINVSTQGIHLWDLKDKILIRRFQGALQTNFLNNSSFGGVNENYMVSGSEDNKVYIWNLKKENPICVLDGHTRNVNSVTWNPVLNGLIASASDDGTVRIWGPSKTS